MKIQNWDSMTPEEQRNQMDAELEEVVKILRAHGRQHILIVIDESEQKHDMRSSIDVNDDHHMMDMLAHITDVWRESNHPKTQP